MMADRYRGHVRLPAALLAVALLGALVGACGSEDGTGGSTGDDVLHPDVVDASAVDDGDTWTISATLSSPYDSPERHADAWRVLGPDGSVLGERILTHHHADEQPFTRSLSGVDIPDDVEVVTIEGRDQVSGWGGGTFELALPER
jgi:hypothetical protein